MGSYWLRVAKRAWREAIGDSPWPTPMRFAIGAISAVAGGAGGYFVSHNVGWSAVWTFAAIGIVIVGRVLLGLIVVPAAMDSEAGKRVKELERQLNPDSEFISIEAAGVWLYENLQEDARRTLRRVAESMEKKVPEWAVAEVRNAAINEICQLHGRWGEGLPLEPVDPTSFSAFEALFGSGRLAPADFSVRRADLPTILQFSDHTLRQRWIN